MFTANGAKSDLQIQIDIVDSFEYFGVVRDVFNAIMDWSSRTTSPIECLCIKLLITDDLELASQQWDGERTIIFLTKERACEVKSGVIINTGSEIYAIIEKLLNTSLGIK